MPHPSSRRPPDTLCYERACRTRGYAAIIGVDEVGRGCLAGPVVAAAVLLRSEEFLCRIDDSKKLTAAQRERAFFEIIEKSLSGIGIVNERVIDQINILEATRVAMEQAVRELTAKLAQAERSSACLLVDGNVTFRTSLPIVNIIHGDALSCSISCASILAKVTRDRIMSLYHRIYPQYGFQENKGYGTVAHRSALKKFGPCLIHRVTFSYADVPA